MNPLKPLWLLCALIPFWGDGQAMEITEILADNSGGLQDEDGQSPGWIELKNPSPVPVSLQGWHLTDDPLRPDKWTFPAISVPAQGYLVIFASGKNRVQTGLPLHTNFQLNHGGEYLALTDAAGAVVSRFAPSFPALRRNLSFAEATRPLVIPLLGPGAAMKYAIPADGADGNTWTQPGFDDSAWSAGNMPAGFDGHGDSGSPLLSLDFNDRDNQSADTTQPGFSAFVIGNTGSNAATQTGTVTRTIGSFQVSLANTGTDPMDDRYRTIPTDNGTLTTHRLLRDFVFSRDQSGTTGLELTVRGLPARQAVEVGIWSYDSSSPGSRVSDWFANGTPARENYTFNGSNLPGNDSAARFTFPAVTTSEGSLVITGRRDPASATFGVFLNALQISPVGFANLITTNLSSGMAQSAGTARLRGSFPVPDPTGIQQLRLRARYDDGFVAWLNGTEIARRNAPPNAAWNSRATAARAAGEATAVEEILIPVTPGLLRTGQNVLAVLGLNEMPDDPDFLMDFALDGVGELAAAPVFYASPTPGAPNASGFPGWVKRVDFAVPRGFYYAPFETAITCSTPGAEIRYTLDGSTPTATTGSIYNGPVSITKTTILRAAAFRGDYLPAEVATQSYLFPELTTRQPSNPPGWPATWGTDSEVPGGTVPADYEMDPQVVNQTQPGYSTLQALNALPSLSVSMPPGDFLGPNGIYQFPKNTGNAWERGCAIEFMDPSSMEAPFAEDCQVEIHGNSSRRPFRVQKHSFRLTFKAELGSPRLNYPLFPGSPVRQFNKLVLRACFTDAWCLVSWDPGRYRPDDATYLRDVWMKRTHEAMGYLAPDSRFCHLYINGLYWGVYNISERIDEDYVASHRGGSPEDWEVVSDFVDSNPSPNSAWKSMFAAANAGLASPAAYASIQQWLNPVAFADYYLLHQFGEAEDWPHHNGYAYRRKTGADTTFQWVVWDQEIALNNHGIDRVTANAPNTTTDRTPGRLLNKLRDNAEFRLLFADRAHYHLHNGGMLDTGPAASRWERLAGTLDKAIVAESARWGDTADATPYGNAGESRPGKPLKPFYTREADWLPTVALTRDTWIPALHNTSNSFSTIRRLQAAGLYPTVEPASLSPHGGISAEGFTVNISAPSGTIYYTLDGSDPREALTGNPLGRVSADPLILTASSTLKTRVLQGGVWSALTQASFIVGRPAAAPLLQVSELYVDPPNDSSDPEFVELLNRSDSTLDLSGARFAGGISYTFPAGSLLAPRARVVITGEQFSGRLDNSGEVLTLLAANGETIFSFRYATAAPWPGGTAGTGHSMVLISASSDPAMPANWRPSLSPGGSPGASDATAFAGDATADLDLDGASDFLEYALASSSTDSSRHPVVIPETAAGKVRVRFNRAAAADDVIVEPQAASDLSGWTASLTLISRQLTAPDVLTEIWEVPASNHPRQFVRLKVAVRP